jgi:quinol-cytochrome oxidoreductase complex cytochrome b subunit
VTALEHFLYEPVPKRGAWLYTLGSATLFLITLQFLTGILLLFYYVPTTDHAWNSVYYIMNEAYFGKLIRGIHYWSANFLMAVIGLHMARTFFSGAYKAPREMNWIVGVILLLLVVGLAFTGYLLRWDQDGFWASVVGIKIGSYSPFLGPYVTHFLLGGDVVGPATLSRFFAIHVWLLPAAIAPAAAPRRVRQRVRVHRPAGQAARAPAAGGVRPARGGRVRAFTERRTAGC